MLNLKEYILIGLAALIVIVFGYVGVTTNLSVLNEKINTLSLVTAMSSKPGTTATYPTTNVYSATDGKQEASIGSATATGAGVCSNSDPVTNLCRTAVDVSYDGFVAYANFTMATGTAKAVYTNNSGVDMMCNRGSGGVYLNATGFSPSIVVGLGETSSATGYAADLIASTTIATSTDTITAFTSVVPFVLESGNSIVASLSDYVAAIASSTYFGNWAGNLFVNCQLIGQ